MTISEIIASYNQEISRSILDELRQYGDAFTQLISVAHIPLETLIALEPAMRDELRQNSYRFTRLISEARQTHRYLIINQIITEEQLVRSLMSQNPYVAVQNFVNEKLTISRTLPEGYHLDAENITDLIQLVKGFAKIRKNSRLIYQAENQKQTLFSKLPTVLNHKIAELTGESHKDESVIVAMNYGKPVI